MGLVKVSTVRNNYYKNIYPSIYWIMLHKTTSLYRDLKQKETPQEKNVIKKLK